MNQPPIFNPIEGPVPTEKEMKRTILIAAFLKKIQDDFKREPTKQEWRSLVKVFIEMELFEEEQ